MTNFIFPLDINKRTNTVTLFLLFAVRVEIAKGEKNLQEAQKSEHQPMLSFWWLACEICISKPRRNVQAVTPEPTFLVYSFFQKKKKEESCLLWIPLEQFFKYFSAWELPWKLVKCPSSTNYVILGIDIAQEMHFNKFPSGSHLIPDQCWDIL